MDKIYIENLKVFAYHGVFPEEKREGQNFYVNAVLEIDAEKARFLDCNVNNYHIIFRVRRVGNPLFKPFSQLLSIITVPLGKMIIYTVKLNLSAKLNLSLTL